MGRPKSICIITCYRQPDYVRARAIRDAIAKNQSLSHFIVKNTKVGLTGYVEVIWNLLKIKIAKNPDIYLVTFRGYEILPIVCLIGFNKKIVFDEFINPLEWMAFEHHKVKQYGILYKVIRCLYRFWLQKVDIILTDTDSHAQFSSQIMDINLGKYQTIFVGNDETVFRRTKQQIRKQQNNIFTVLYYGSMLPLHGVGYVLEAFEALRGQQVKLILIGGNNGLKNKVEIANSHGAVIEYVQWVKFEDLPKYINRADLCLAGPFGGTFQSQFVITGKAYQFLSMSKAIIIGKNLETGVFRDKHNAILVKQADSASLKSAIVWAMKNPERLRVIAKNGHDIYESKFSAKQMSKDIDKLISSLVM